MQTSASGGGGSVCQCNKIAYQVSKTYFKNHNIYGSLLGVQANTYNIKDDEYKVTKTDRGEFPFTNNKDGRKYILKFSNDGFTLTPKNAQH